LLLFAAGALAASRTNKTSQDDLRHGCNDPPTAIAQDPKHARHAGRPLSARRAARAMTRVHPEQPLPVSLPVSGWSRADLDELALAIRHTHGPDVSTYEASFLAKSLELRHAQAGCSSRAAYLQRLLVDRDEADLLLRSLNISYSAFFRNPLTFALLAQSVLPNLLDTADHAGIRIWSAGCAAGQEAWSLAMQMDDLAAGREQPVPFRIIATDISDDALTRARRGIYDFAEVQNVPLKFARTYLVGDGDNYTIAPTLRKRVDFSAHDLLDAALSSPAASIYGDFDLVICSNVLFYYRSDIRQHIIDKLCQTLRPGGYFVTGEAEREIVVGRKELQTVSPSTAVFRRRGAAREQHG
jgi:chemotaxis methyl-accepting protein methylase